MIFRQLFDYNTYTYTYLIADCQTRKAALIDPVLNQIPAYLQLLNDLDITLDSALDTHVHADHITALGKLREETTCQTYIGKPGDVACADNNLSDGQKIQIGELHLKAMYTPGHTDDSFCFYLEDMNFQNMVFTGDTLLIRGCGRTDFQNGDSEKLYDSLHDTLLALPENTIVYPGHDYKGWSQSTIGEEKHHNPRLQIKKKTEFVDFMNKLILPDPKFMDIAVPANLSCGKT